MMSNLFDVRPTNLMDFGSDTGVYLGTAEIQNWGPFCGKWVIPLKSLPSLFVGENGTGKSSLMDGILTLLVKRVKYNNATDNSGHAAGQRKLIEYVRGFKESSRGDDLSKNVLYLREKGEVTIILLRFTVGERFVTLANVFMEKDGNEVAALYVYKEGYLSIDSFPKDAGSFEEYRALLNKVDGVNVVDKTKYFAFIQDKLALDSNGMKLLASLSSQKDLRDAGAVIRTYMFLEQNDYRKNYEDTKQAIERIKIVLNKLEELRKQDEILSNLVPIIKEGRQLQKEFALWNNCKEKLSSYVYRCAKPVAEKELDKLKVKVAELDKKKDNLNSTLNESIRSQSALEFKRDNKGGTEIKQKEFEAKTLEERKERMESLCDAYTVALSSMGIKADFSNEFSFNSMLEVIKKEKSDTAQASDKAYHLCEKAKEEAMACGDVLRKLEAERRRLEAHKVAIDDRLVSVRDEVCASLGIDNSVMPFLGEYLSVDDKEWVPALEHLLYFDSTAFLVPTKYAKQVASFFKAHKRSYMTIRYRVMTKVNATDSDGAWTKISVRKDMPYVDWVEPYIKKIARHSCCETEEEFNNTFPAIMKNGLIRSDSQRHTIDEKRDIRDARNFVMSGSYKERCVALDTDIESARNNKTMAEKEIVQTQKNLKEILVKKELLESLPFIKSYEDVDMSKIEIMLQECNNTLSMLKNSKDLAKLDENLRQLDLKIKNLEADRKVLDVEYREACLAVDKMQSNMDEKQKVLDTITFSAEEETLLKELFDKRKPSSANPKFETIMSSITWMTRDVNEKVKDLDRVTKETCRQAEFHMREYISVCISRKNELEPNMDKEGEAERFIEEYNRVHDEFLPEAKQKAKEAGVMGGKMTLTDFIIALTHNVDKSVQQIIDKINDTLHRVPYSQDVNPTFLDVGCKRTKDPAVVELRRRLEEVSRYIGDPANEEEMLIKSAELMDYIGTKVDRIRANTYSKDNILDIRNWFEYPVAECRWQEDGKEFYHVKELDEVAKQSGGEGVKLTYFIMAACYSMWMHLLDDDYADRTFRFLMIDEIDTKISPSNLKDVIMLFNLLGIQLVSLLPIGDKVSQYEGFVGNIVCTGYLRKPESYVDTISYADYMERNKKQLEERLQKGKDIYNG